MEMNKEIFEGLPQEKKWGVVYDMLEKMNRRLDCLERPGKKYNKTIATISAFIGGVIAGAISFLTNHGAR